MKKPTQQEIDEATAYESTIKYFKLRQIPKWVRILVVLVMTCGGAFFFATVLPENGGADVPLLNTVILFVVAAAPMLVIMVVGQVIVASLLIGPGYCPWCKYDIRQSIRDKREQCPECGHDIHPEFH